MPLGSHNIFMILFTALWLFVIIKLAVRAIRNRTAPVKSVKATVVDKRSSVPVREFNNSRRAAARYYITFRTEDGENIELLVSMADYIAILADAEGYLTYKGGRIVDFKRIEK